MNVNFSPAARALACGAVAAAALLAGCSKNNEAEEKMAQMQQQMQQMQAQMQQQQQMPQQMQQQQPMQPQGGATAQQQLEQQLLQQMQAQQQPQMQQQGGGQMQAQMQPPMQQQMPPQMQQPAGNDPAAAARATNDLFNAVLDGNITKVKLALENGANVNFAKKYKGITPLHLAAQNGDAEMVQLLIAWQADVNAKDDEGRSVLNWALVHKHEHIAEMLMAAGARQ